MRAWHLTRIVSVVQLRERGRQGKAVVKRAKASCQEKNRASNTLITLKQQVPTKIKL